jgi:hypothetical protein
MPTQTRRMPLAVSNDRPYWPRRAINGRVIDLSHLEPLVVLCPVEKLGRTLKIDVRFTNHCFTDHFDPEIHEPSWKIMDGKKERVFCPRRYHLSRTLPEIITRLPTVAVNRTRSDRNFVFVATIEDEAGRYYSVFFRMKKERRNGCELSIVVESAYEYPDVRALLSGTTKISFRVLSARTFEGKPVKSNIRR